MPATLNRYPRPSLAYDRQKIRHSRDVMFGNTDDGEGVYHMYDCFLALGNVRFDAKADVRNGSGAEIIKSVVRAP